MGKLIVGVLDFNDVDAVSSFVRVVQTALVDRRFYYPLQFKPSFYFSAPPGVTLPSESGWYIILRDNTPIYVGQANDLNERLNSNQGSLDNFAKKGRSSDAERNFIKKFEENGYFPRLRVFLLTRTTLTSGLGISNLELSSTDIDNVEKVLNILRGLFNYE